MYQAQQEAELGELQNQENVKNNSSNQSDCNSSVCLETLKTQHRKQSEELCKELFWYSQWKLINKYRMGR